MTKAKETYELYYWPGIQGRGEFVRLAFEAVGEAYVDVVRLPASKGGGVPAMTPFLSGKAAGGIAPLAPPFLRVGELVIAQTTNILHYLGPRLGLVPRDEASVFHANQLMLTIADIVAEAHDTHHPIATSKYYKEQKKEARRRTAHFVAERIPKYLQYFERILQSGSRKGSPGLLGADLSYVDLGLFQVMSGLAYAFPRAMAHFEPELPRCVALRDDVAAHPGVAAYLASDRRLPFNENGIFRHYKELDLDPETALASEPSDE